MADAGVGTGRARPGPVWQPPGPEPRPSPPHKVTTRLRELHHTIETGDRHREGVLQTIAFNLDAWAGQVRREKAIYHTLNKLSMDASKKVRGRGLRWGRGPPCIEAGALSDAAPRAA
jgi:hypothetical protein